jgi:N6-L-threonylcarbamoyladenine synthase
MEGHIYSSLIQKEKNNIFSVNKIYFPTIALLISGGHTDLVLMKKESSYKIIGSTLDDAVGEAYDKSARLLGIDYPGGPEVSRLADEFIKSKKNNSLNLPRPMLNKNNFDFSFSGLKTAVLYLVREKKKININFKRELSAEFEDAVSEVLTKKTLKALKKHSAKGLVIGGGVSANNRLRSDFKKLAEKENFKLYLPDKKYTGDNALMIALAGYYNFKNKKTPKNIKKVFGNLKLK